MNVVQFLSSQTWVEHLGWALIHFLWQGALVAVFYAVVRSRLSHSRSRYALACVALAAMVAAPAITFLLTGPRSTPHNPFIGNVPVSTAADMGRVSLSIVSSPFVAASAWHDDVMPGLVMAWFAGAIVFWIRLTGGSIVAARMRSVSVRPAPVEWQQILDNLRTRIRVSCPVRLLVSAFVQVPTVVGWLRPVVLVPVGALTGLPPEHIEALLTHELAHIRRHDYFVNILQSIAEALLFYHPAVWWISNHIRDERELCCDDVAVAITGDVFTYATALADLEAYRPAHFSPALAASAGSLPERIGRLLGQSAPATRPLPGPGALVAAVLIVMTAYGLLGQSQPARPSFEAASIKPNDLGAGHMHIHTTPGRLTAGMTTRRLIGHAFDIKDFQISGGPTWLGSDNYDIVATTGTPVDLNNIKVLEPYLQSLLADRFHLKYHRETRRLPVYSLVAAKNGPKLTKHTGTEGAGTDSEGNAEKVNFTGTKLSMTDFAGFLSRDMDRPVIDKTGIKGEFDLKLEWARDEATETTLPSIFTALQEQLGLKLDSGKGPVDILVVDSVEKPSEN